jgi:hypothetical protein
VLSNSSFPVVSSNIHLCLSRRKWQISARIHSTWPRSGIFSQRKWSCMG